MSKRSKRRVPKPLTEHERIVVFELRCRSRKGQHVTQDEIRLAERAIADDAERYSAMDADVFKATRPYGSF